MRRTLKSSLDIANRIMNNKIGYNMSAFKNKLAKIQQNNYLSISNFYDDLMLFQGALSNLQKLKYKKSKQNLERKINKLRKKQLMINEQDQQKQISKVLYKPFNTSISYQLFYNIENTKYKPIDQSMKVNKIQLKQLFEVIMKQKSMFSKDLQLITQLMLSNPSVNQSLYDSVRIRCQYLQEQLSMSIYESFVQIIKKTQEQNTLEQNNKKRLKKLKHGDQKQTIFTQDFKFTLKPNLTPEQNYQASQIGKLLTKYNFSSQKTKMMSLKSLSNEGYKSLTPASLKNHLFILGYHKDSIKQLNDNLYKLFDILCQISDISQTKTQFLGEIGPLNSLLFYMLSNKIQIYQLLRSILLKIAENYKKQVNFEVENYKVNQFDLELFCLMLKVLKSKYQLSFESLKKDLNLSVEDLDTISIDKLSDRLIKIQNDASEDFQKYLKKRLYQFQIISYQNQHDSIYKIMQDKVYRIQDRMFICLNLTRLDKNSEKANGVGQLILQYFKILGNPLKIINPLFVSKCERWSEKQDYFKSKLKGLKEPEYVRSNRFQF